MIPSRLIEYGKNGYIFVLHVVRGFLLLLFGLLPRGLTPHPFDGLLGHRGLDLDLFRALRDCWGCFGLVADLFSDFLFLLLVLEVVVVVVLEVVVVFVRFDEAFLAFVDVADPAAAVGGFAEASLSLFPGEESQVSGL